jgi:hypothetical protein
MPDSTAPQLAQIEAVNIIASPGLNGPMTTQVLAFPVEVRDEWGDKPVLHILQAAVQQARDHSRFKGFPNGSWVAATIVVQTSGPGVKNSCCIRTETSGFVIINQLAKQPV